MLKLKKLGVNTEIFFMKDHIHGSVMMATKTSVP
jgi:hypothetical protein